MLYDEQKLCQLDGEARAAAFRLGKVLSPVQNRLQQELDAFDLLTATSEQCQRRGEIEALLAVMEAYCQAADSLNEQLRTNLTTTEEALHREATRASFMARQFQLTHEELLREKTQSTKWLALCQDLLAKKGGPAV